MSQRKRFLVCALMLLVLLLDIPVPLQEVAGTSQDIIASGDATDQIVESASGNVSGDAVEEKITIYFRDEEGNILKMININKGASVELWTPSIPNQDIEFVGWYIIFENEKIRVTENDTFNESTNIIAVTKRVGPIDGINYALEESQSKAAQQQEKDNKIIARCQSAAKHVKLKITDVKIKNKKNIVFKVKSSSYLAARTIEVQYSTSKKFKKRKTKTKYIKQGKNKLKSRQRKGTLKKLKKNKSYYIRARINIIYNGNTLRGKWSKVKKIKLH